MSLLRMIWNEIKLRKWSFASGCVAMAAAIGVIISSSMTLEGHALQSEVTLAKYRQDVKETTAVWQDEIRKAVLQFNAVVLPEGQNLEEWLEKGYGSKTMPADYADKLSHAKLISIRHILPSLQRWVQWPEMKRQVLLIGTRGDTLDLHKNPKKPMVQPVPDGAMVLGHELARVIDLDAGDTADLMGRQYNVHKVHEERGNKDDMTVWIPLADAQSLLNEEGRINAILALQCMCVGAEGLPRVRSDIHSILPGTQVFELGSDKALARIESRTRAKKEARKALDLAEERSAAIGARIQKVNNVLTPLVIILAVSWVAVVGYGNVKRRRRELGVLRAIGMKTRTLLTLFLSRSLLMGIAGAVGGLLIGSVVGWQIVNIQSQSGLAVQVLHNFFSAPLDVLFLLLIAPCLAILAGWIPSFIAAQTDPAKILAEE